MTTTDITCDCQACGDGRCGGVEQCTFLLCRCQPTGKPQTITDSATDWAIRTVARRVLAQVAAEAIKLGGTAASGENHPDIGQYDWERVLADVRRLAERTDVQGEHYESAYRHLAGRARETEEGPQ